MSSERPDPDELLRRVVEESARAAESKLTIFFGAAPGVGKTYAMLEAARAELEREKRDVVVGVVETHGRYETGAMLLGLDLLARRKVLHRGVQVEEFDLDAALARRPNLILVDELAHTNTEGSRHPKRWQDVEELLEAGIDVFTTLNVQHVESLNDLVARITGVTVRETVPDSFLERAHAIKLVDLPPDDLLERLREGKVYVATQAQRAIDNFFRKGNLIALRELALRHTAERVDAQMREYRRAQGIEQAWAIVDQLLVAVSPSPYSARLIRGARRIASSMHARWFAVYVEAGGARRLPETQQIGLSRNLRLAAQLGAEVVTLQGDDAADEILRFARARGITKLIVGKPAVTRLRDRFRVSLVDRLVRRSGDIDVYVTAGDPEEEQYRPGPRERAPYDVPGLAAAAAVTAASSAVAWLVFGRDQLPDVVMVYLLGIVLVSSRFALRASIAAALMSVAAFDFVFVPPYLTFAVGDLRHVTTFVVLFVVAVVISGLTGRVRNQAELSREREARTAALYALSRELAAAQGPGVVVGAAAHIERVFGSRVTVFTPGAGGRLERAYATDGSPELGEQDLGIAHWVWSNHREAGLGTTALPGGSTLYLPLMASGDTVGVLALTPGQPKRFDNLEERRHLDGFAAQMAVAMERALLAERTQTARKEIEAEQLRSSLLSSVSHDLRTPLAVITGASSTLLQSTPAVDDATRRDLQKTIFEEAERLNRLIGNLLDMTRLEFGAVRIHKEWLPLEEVIGSALDRLETRLAHREVRVDVPADLPLVPCDAVLIEQALINLLENAAKYGEGALELTVRAHPAEIVVDVADRGPGIPEGHEARIFEKFQRGGREGGPSGVGLGLTICRAILAAHAGRIWAWNRAGGGACFRFALPLEGEPPALPVGERLEPNASEAT